ncbi:MAG: hemolysin III family protein [Tissierellia bacterium]|nr:hemolysin III family protein [Tissierellia bacterium]
MIDKKAEKFNVLTHLCGVLIGLIFLIATIIKYPHYQKKIFAGLIIYLSTFILLFLSSSIYHQSKFLNSKYSKALRVLDHSAIFIFIAGSFTPVLIYLFEGWQRNLSLILIWTIAIFGILYKLFSKDNYDRTKKISTLLYIAMGWLAVFLLFRIYKVFGLNLLLVFALGGVAYTFGTVFYKNEKWRYNHVIWHLFVLLGAILQMIPIMIVIA